MRGNVVNIGLLASGAFLAAALAGCTPAPAVAPATPESVKPIDWVQGDWECASDGMNSFARLNASIGPFDLELTSEEASTPFAVGYREESGLITGEEGWTAQLGTVMPPAGGSLTIPFKDASGSPIMTVEVTPDGDTKATVVAVNDAEDSPESTQRYDCRRVG